MLMLLSNLPRQSEGWWVILLAVRNSNVVYWTVRWMEMYLCISIGRIKICLADSAAICGYNVGT
jgi:hypothetical protein